MKGHLQHSLPAQKATPVHSCPLLVKRMIPPLLSALCCVYISIHPHSQDKSVVPLSEDRCRPSRVQGFPLEGVSFGSSLLCSALANHELTCHNRISPTAFGSEVAPQPQLLHMTLEVCLLLEEILREINLWAGLLSIYSVGVFLQ